LAAALAGCSVLPATGPNSDAVRENPTTGISTTTPLPYALVNVSSETIGILSEPNLITFTGAFTDKRPKPVQVLGVGDVLNVSIFEAAPGGLFTPAQAAGARPGNFVELPAQAIDQSGNINVPYAGTIPVAGRTIPEVQASIQARLQNRAIEPQIVVSLNTQRSTIVSVLGDVNTPGVLGLSSTGERILSVLARAGGPKYEAIESYVTLQRDGKRIRVLLARIVRDPRENIFIRPNDVIFITREPPTFTALGATGLNTLTGTNAFIAFDTETLTLTQALGKAGGLVDAQSDPEAVFVYRLEQRSLLNKLNVNISAFPYDSIPTIYQVNLREPSGLLLAAGFQMKDKDVIYVANAKVVDYYKLLTLINNTATTVNNINTTSRAVSAPWNR
jgi:polysaccharide export outer membrane protein